MSTNDPRGSAGVAKDEDVALVIAPRPDSACRGCLADGHDGNHRIPKGHPGAGHLRPGHTSNALGRPRGRLNNTTLEAAVAIRGAALRAAQVVIREMESRNPMIALAAARTIMDRTLPDDLRGDLGDSTWMEHATDEELLAITEIVAAARERAESVVRVPAPAPASEDEEPEPPLPEPPLPDPDAEESFSTEVPDDAS